MVLKDKKTGKIICRDLKIVNSFLGKLFGVSIQKDPKPLFFKTRLGIHTFLLKDPIDILVLDNNFRVVKMKKGLKPNRLFFWSPNYPYAVELPKGYIKKVDLRQAQTLKIC